MVSAAARAQPYSIGDCLDCHDDPEIVEDAEKPRRGLVVREREYKRSVHGKEPCTGCHKDATDDHDVPLAPAECGDCHRREVGEYRMGVHFSALEKGDPFAPTCRTCHGVHDMKSAGDSSSPTHIMNIPITCGQCHKEGSKMVRQHTLSQHNVIENYSMSIHGKGLFQSGLKVTAVCISCHRSHEILPHTDSRSSIHRSRVTETCMQCHAAIDQVHDQIVEGESWKQGDAIPVCVDCHAPHVLKPAVKAQNLDDAYCKGCHQDREKIHQLAPALADSLFFPPESFRSTAHAEVPCVKCHVDVSFKRDPVCKDSKKVECGSCHTETADTYGRSVHGVLFAEGDSDAPDCLTCHGTHAIGARSDRESAIYRSSVPSLCGRCHRVGEPAAKRINNHTELVEHYQMSIHGKALTERGLLVTAICTDCHTSHGELPAGDTLSSVNRGNIARTCAECHEGILETFSTSIHAPGTSTSTDTLPVCNDCHSSHDIVRVDRDDFRQGIISQCGSCHEDLVESYFDSYHGKASKLGWARTAKCSDCHGSHGIYPADDSRSPLHTGNILGTCRQCHPKAKAGFTAFIAHADYHDGEKYPALHRTYVFMTWLVLGTFGFFGLHTLVWLVRSLVAGWRERGRKPALSGKWIRRFPGFYSALHVAVIVSFLGLALTGVTLKYPDHAWSHWLSHILGGVVVSGFIHRFFALITFGYFILHLFGVAKAYRRGGKKLLPFLLGSGGLVPSAQDLKDFAATVKWFVGLGPKPRYGRWTYWEKFDYFAVFWGVAIIGASGLMLWMPEFFTAVLPGWAINVAAIVHSDEALLAMGFIFTIHFFNTHFRPEKFPMDMVIFTGRMPLEVFQAERPREYQEALEEHRLQDLMAPPPHPALVFWSRVFGAVALALGVLIIGLIMAGWITHGLQI